MTEARVVAVLILTDAVEEVVTVSIECLTGGITDARIWVDLSVGAS